jgi:hypothetical protein
MLERLKSVLVDSYVGAIGIGLMFSQGIAIFANALTAPLRESLLHWGSSGTSGLFSAAPGFRLQSILPELLNSAFLVLIGYVLLRWLYYPVAEKRDQEQTPEPEQDA